MVTNTHTHTHIRFIALWTLSGITRVSQYQNQPGFYWSKRQWVAVVSAGPYANLQAGCPSCYPTNSIKALKVQLLKKA